SAEFAGLYPGGLTNSAFVSFAYTFLRRPVDAGGLAFWTGELDGGRVSRAGLVFKLIDSSEYTTTVAPVYRFYQSCLRRLPDPNGFTDWANFLRAGHSINELAQGFAGSAEFQNRTAALSNQAFVELMYQDILGRPVDPVGLNGWTALLNSGQAAKA